MKTRVQESADEALAIAIMEQSFDGNPAVHFTIGHAGSYLRRRHYLARFMYRHCARRKGVFLSPHQQAVICYYASDASYNSIHQWIDECVLAINAIGIIRLPSVWKRSVLIARHHKKQRPFLHCWYIGALPSARDGKEARALRTSLFEKSKLTRRCILAETTMEQNMRVYCREGFYVYGTVVVDGLTTWLLRRDWDCKW